MEKSPKRKQPSDVLVAKEPKKKKSKLDSADNTPYAVSDAVLPTTAVESSYSMKAYPGKLIKKSMTDPSSVAGPSKKPPTKSSSLPSKSSSKKADALLTRPPEKWTHEEFRKHCTKWTEDEFWEVLEGIEQHALAKTKYVPFRDLRIFYVGNPTEIRDNRIYMRVLARHGGHVLRKYSPEDTTHIMANAGRVPFSKKNTDPVIPDLRSTLRACGVESLSNIPSEIPIIKWSWVKPAIRTNVDFQHAVFYEQRDAIAKRKIETRGRSCSEPLTNEHGSAAESDSEIEVDNADDGRNVLVSSPTSLHTQEEQDALAPFYDQARMDAVEETQTDGEADHHEQPEQLEPARTPRGRLLKGFRCDDPTAGKEKCINQDIIDALSQLKDIHAAKPSDDDRWRVMSYNKMIGSIRKCKPRIKTYEDARALPFVGDKSAQKIVELVKTGKLDRIAWETSEDVLVARIFIGIYGVGRNIALQWYQAGLRTLDDVREGKGGVQLTVGQKIGLEHYDDINDRMPREEAGAIFEKIRKIALEIDHKLFIEIMGSYRRGKATCGDIDILITRPTVDGRTHAGIIKKLHRKLHAAGILTEDLALPEDWSAEESAYKGLCRLGPEGRRRRIDILAIPYKCRGGALLYYTGDDIFNRSMRLKANYMGYSLNQRGLYKDVIRDVQNRHVKLHRGTLMASETEEEIFKILGVKWQEPHERVRS